jgi:hypothetical protein
VATRKAGSRRLVVDGHAYRWRIRRRATYTQIAYGYGTLHVAVHLEEDPGAVLVLYTDRAHPKDCFPRPIVPVRPSDIAGWIRQAIRAGWMPSKHGAQFQAWVVGTSLERSWQKARQAMIVSRRSMAEQNTAADGGRDAGS